MRHARIITTKTTTKNEDDDCVGIRRNINRFGRWETHESKQRRLYIYQRAIALVTHLNWLFWAMIWCANLDF